MSKDDITPIKLDSEARQWLKDHARELRGFGLSRAAKATAPAANFGTTIESLLERGLTLTRDFRPEYDDPDRAGKDSGLSL